MTGVALTRVPPPAQRSGGAPQGRPGSSRARRRGALYLAFSTPALALLILTNAYPLIYAAGQSLHHGTLIMAGDFVGLGNYTDLLKSPAFWQAARFTAIFTVVGVFGSWAVGMALALLLRLDMPAKSFLKVLLLVPWVVPIIVSATAWHWLVAAPDSIVPRVLALVGLGDVQVLASPVLTGILVCAFKVWASTPFMMLVISAALEGIDGSVYEAALIDGANPWQRFREITLPLISRTTYISWVLMAIFCVNDFATIYLLSGGGPLGSTTSLTVLAYNSVFLNQRVGPGTAIAFMMTVLLVIVSLMLHRQIKKSGAQ